MLVLLFLNNYEMRMEMTEQALEIKFIYSKQLLPDKDLFNKIKMKKKRRKFIKL